MKKNFTLFGFIVILALYAGAQTNLAIYELPNDIKTTSGVLYFKLTPLVYDSLPSIPYTQPGDATICLSEDTANSLSAPAGWGFYSCQLRTTKKSNSGYLDIRDQGNPAGNYVAVDTVRWEFGATYRCWIDIDYSAMTYSVYVLKVGDNIADQKTIGETAAFRNQVTQLNLLSIVSSNNFATDTISSMQVVANTTTIPSDVGISTLASQTRLVCYPNPAKNFLTIKYGLETSAKVKVSIFDMTGKEVMVLANRLESSGQHQINARINGLNSGIYMIRLQAGNYTDFKKLIIE